MYKHQRPISVAITALLVLALAGCAQYKWQKYGSNRSEFNRDSYECQMEAAKAYPTVMVAQQQSPGYTTAATTSCRGNGSAYGVGGTIYGNNTVNCTTTPGQVVAPVTYAEDANSNNRSQAAKSCMYARGYKLVRVE